MLLIASVLLIVVSPVMKIIGNKMYLGGGSIFVGLSYFGYFVGGLGIFISLALMILGEENMPSYNTNKEKVE